MKQLGFLLLLIVKLQSKLNSSVQVGQGVDFVFPLSQQEQQQEEEQDPHQNLPERSTLQTWDLEHRLNSQNQDLTHNPWDGHPPSQGWSPNIPWNVTHHPKDGHPPCPGWSKTNSRMVIHHLQDGNPPTHIPRMVTHHPLDGHHP